MSDTAENSADTAAEELKSKIDDKYIIFSIQGRQYTFPSRFVNEIAIFDKVYPLPLVPSCILGIINRYSIPYALFDIGLLLFKTSSPRRKMLIMKDEIDRIAFLIDDVTGIVEVSGEKLLEVERNDVTELVSSAFNLNGSDVFVLDIQSIMACVTAEAA